MNAAAIAMKAESTVDHGGAASSGSGQQQPVADDGYTAASSSLKQYLVLDSMLLVWKVLMSAVVPLHVRPCFHIRFDDGLKCNAR